MTKLFIGVDGGGTKTLTVVIDEQGNELGRHHSGGSNHHSVGEELAREAIFEGIKETVKKAGGSLSDVARVCLGISGIDRPEDQVLVGTWMNDILPSVTYDVSNDAVIALASGTMGKLYGCVIISGTGCIAYGFNRQGKSTRSAGWGPLLGDEGAGYQVGFDMLKAIVSAKDETRPKTLMTDKVLTQLCMKSEDELITWAYDPKNQGWQKFAQLAPIATECALAGDVAAQQVLDKNVQAMVEYIQSVFVKLGLDKESESVPLVLAGGNIERECLYSNQLKASIAKILPNAKPVFPSCDSGKGAALLALEKYKSASTAEK
ncbi:hypothetical protein DFA_06831 [Cavenderia fasciculata]|uniref:N-acetyl-D-glucosamine kinase n=1 Tax=Cavenderia fasciculata TaxID=261658 RepID=F4Q2E4_CACFS|nr:uncharacterized protein DFA_06831 [Cavenderia fasciculata]EGG18164.1 hypothetical protein DFA_06831 [Cavenderia fasciculata]|eukprot:XP_004366205.1 hypothetical protein DFA_06831 [Cavenderia fasciculata]